MTSDRLTDEQVRILATANDWPEDQREEIIAALAREVQESRAEIAAERALADRLARTGSDLPLTDSTLGDINLHHAGKCEHRCTICAKKAWLDTLDAYNEARRED
jgi:hypothetical protein